jgi:hypothetical protein
VSRIGLGEFINEVLQELADLAEPLRSEIAKAATEPEGRRVAPLRAVLERSTSRVVTGRDTPSRDG